MDFARAYGSPIIERRPREILPYVVEGIHEPDVLIRPIRDSMVGDVKELTAPVCSAE
jgi:hypothetical protein